MVATGHPERSSLMFLGRVGGRSEYRKEKARGGEIGYQKVVSRLFEGGGQGHDGRQDERAISDCKKNTFS